MHVKLGTCRDDVCFITVNSAALRDTENMSCWIIQLPIKVVKFCKYMCALTFEMKRKEKDMACGQVVSHTSFTPPTNNPCQY